MIACVLVMVQIREVLNGPMDVPSGALFLPKTVKCEGTDVKTDLFQK